MVRRSIFRDRVKHDIDLLLTARGAKGIAHYSYKEDKFILKAGSMFIGDPVSSLCCGSYDRIFNSYEYLVRNNILVDNILKQDITFSSLGSMGTLVSMAPIYSDGVKLADSKLMLKRVLSSPSLYNKYIAHCEYYDKDWNVIYKEANTEDAQSKTEGTEELLENALDGLDGEDLAQETDDIDTVETDSIDLSQYSTADIIREILLRIANII